MITIEIEQELRLIQRDGLVAAIRGQLGTSPVTVIGPSNGRRSMWTYADGLVRGPVSFPKPQGPDDRPFVVDCDRRGPGCDVTYSSASDGPTGARVEAAQRGWVTVWRSHDGTTIPVLVDVCPACARHAGEATV